jgi:hypothetical protein
VPVAITYTIVITRSIHDLAASRKLDAHVCARGEN